MPELCWEIVFVLCEECAYAQKGGKPVSSNKNNTNYNNRNREEQPVKRGDTIREQQPAVVGRAFYFHCW